MPLGSGLPTLLLPELSMSMSFSSPPVTQCWALEELFVVADPLGSSSLGS